jgi:hypothetical protein
MLLLANIGLPMIMEGWRMVCALIPVIFLETWIMRGYVELSYREVLAGVTRANLFSTFVGLPLAWLIMFAMEYAVLTPASVAAEHWHWNLEAPVFRLLGVLVSIPWLGSFLPDERWRVALASALLLFPCFFVSVWLEHRSCAQRWKNANQERLYAGVYRANLASYALLFLLACVWLGHELLLHKNRS